jgi:hypothetical protein
VNRNAITLLCLGLLGAALVVGPVLRPNLVPPKLAHSVEDFGAYWCAARIWQSGGNPYDAEALRPLEQAIDPDRVAPIITWSPPWAISIVAPLTAFEFPAARWLWMLFQLVALAGCAAVIWRVYDGDADRIGLAWLLAFGFYPTLQLVALGQMSLLTLMAVTGFLAWVDRRPLLAGACLALILVKPHNVVPFGIAFLVWAVRTRNWRTVAGGLGAVAVWTAAIVAINPFSFSLYRETMAANPPGMMKPPTVGTFLRIFFGLEHSLWPQFVPTIVAAVWAAGYATWSRRTWEWKAATPALLFAGVLGSPYGWVYDSVVLLVPILSAATRVVSKPRIVIGAYLAVTAVCVVGYGMGWEEVTFVWLPWLVFFSWCLSSKGPPPTPPPSPPTGEGNKANRLSPAEGEGKTTMP